MSLKNIHLLFITLAILTIAIFAFWAIMNKFLISGIVSIALAIVVSIYGLNFLKKIKSQNL